MASNDAAREVERRINERLRASVRTMPIGAQLMYHASNVFTLWRILCSVAVVLVAAFLYTAWTFTPALPPGELLGAYAWYLLGRAWDAIVTGGGFLRENIPAR